MQELVYEIMHVKLSVTTFKSGNRLKSLHMKKVLSREDKAVSPIIATVLLVGITVTMIATAYTLLENYIPNPVAQTPSAAIKVVYETHVSGSFYSANYSVFINSLNGNVSVNDVNVVVTFSDNSVIEVPLQQVSAAGNSLVYSSTMTVGMQSSGGYITSASMINLYLHDSTSHVTRIALVDTATDGSIGSSLIQ